MSIAKAGKVAGVLLGLLVAAYFIVRAVVELFVVDFGDPSSYSGAWGGPTLAGVLAVHCGPGLVCAAIVAFVVARKVRRSRQRQAFSK